MVLFNDVVRIWQFFVYPYFAFYILLIEIYQNLKSICCGIKKLKVDVIIKNTCPGSERYYPAAVGERSKLCRCL